MRNAYACPLLLSALLAGAVRSHAQFVIALPDSGCLLPASTALVELFDVTGRTAGQVHCAAAGAAVNAYLAPDNREWVYAALAGRCAADTAAEMIGVRITRLTLAESESAGQVRSGAYADIEFLSWRTDAWRVRYRAEGLLQTKGDARDEGRHGRNLIGALRHAADQYAAARAEGRLIDAPYQPGGAALDPGGYAILGMPRSPAGVFWSAEDFRNGRLAPMSDSLLAVDNIGNFRLRGDLRRRQEEIYAVSDGRRYHMRWQGRFVPLTREGNGFSAVIKRTEWNPGMGIAFGAIGLLMTARTEHIPMRLDLVSGLLEPVQSHANEATVRQTLHLSRFAPAESRVTIHAWDEAIELEPGAYCELLYPAYSGSELVRVSSASGDLYLALDASSNADAFHLIGISQEGLPESKTVNSQTKEALMRQLRPSMQRPKAER